ncbi:MAG: PrsW family intramembrane metalloprotease [Bacteroidales bacterium]|jgi:RsiW-degrading membrane proteinase PrsW (M82 family)|nr:PrsW family glutamic-type intramembrane protease [Bacteroidales bacterium]HPE99909.1 PrsW family glutamic-type intramembrane protease [Bacteroidales bacterium]
MLIASLAFAPVLALGLFIYLKDKYDREPMLWLLLAFVAGILTIAPAIVIERLLEGRMGMGISPNFGSLMLNAFVVVALTEELCKFAVLRIVFYRKRFFSEPINGIVYAVMLSLGFAFAESVLHLVGAHNIYVTAIFRSFTAVPAHFMFAVFMGYFMGQARFTYFKHRFWLILTGLGLAVFAHGFYDLFLLAWWMPADFQFVSYGFLFAGIVIAVLFINKAQSRSPFMKRRKWLRTLEKIKERDFQEFLASQKKQMKNRRENMNNNDLAE